MWHLKQFVVARVLGDDKVSCDPFTGLPADAHNPANWLTFEDAKARADAMGWCVGFVCTEADPYFFLDIDIDKHIQSDTWHPLTQELCAALQGCYFEVSTSGRGVHLIGRYSGAVDHACKNVPLHLELYTSKRFVLLTGTGATGSPDFDCTPALLNVVAKYFTKAVTGPQADWTDEPDPEWLGPEDDDELIDKMIKSSGASQVFGGRATIAQLWHAEDALAEIYPSSSGDAYDRSSADAALLSHLAFWTGKNCERMQRLFERSDLVRDKWHDREDYRVASILNACTSCQNVYRNPRASKAAPAPIDTPGSSGSGYLEGYQYLPIDQQVEYFGGCVYVTDQHKILTPSGTLLKPEQFKARFGGWEFAMDMAGKKSTKSAWEAFTESRGFKFPKVDSTCFRPAQQPGGIIRTGNRTLVNTYVPIETPSEPGDVSPFLDLLAKLLPDTRDREILTSYMAACVQHVGVKFQWCPVLQGCEGNGKTLINEAMTFCMGEQYTHIKNAQDLGNVFNAWVVRKLFVAIEEVYTPDNPHLMEALKPLVSNSVNEIQGKGADQVNGDNYANIIMNSNHRNGLKAAADARRYAVFFTAQQTAADLNTCGMGGSYFPDLYRWARSVGYPRINHFLMHYQIADEFNPAVGAHRAPETSSTAAAIRESLGPLEQEISEAVAEGRPGFLGGWVSSMAVVRLFSDSRRRPPARNRIPEILKNLGYMPHPRLPDGRCTGVSAVDQGKPRLYVCPGHLSENIRDPRDVLAAYVKAQQPGAEGLAEAIFSAKP